MQIKQNFFSGERPRTASHLTKDYEAQIAQNCDLSRGDLRPMKEYQKVKSLSEAGDLQSLYLWMTTDNYWIASMNDLDFARSPIAGEAHDRVYVTGMTEPRVLTKTIISSPFDFTTDYYKLGVPAPTAALTIGGSYTAGSVYRAYLYSYVVKLQSYDAEEGLNSAIASISDYGSGDVTLSGFTEPPTARSIGKIRIYRTSGGSSGVGEFLFVGEFDTDGVDFTTYTFTDDVDDSGLGEAFPGETWTPPPVGLRGLIGPDGGSLAGFVDNRVYVSEPYLPHAWPYSYPVDSAIVGLGWIGSSIVVLTDEIVYLLTGQAEAMSTTKLSGRFPCVAKKGIVSCENGVLFPSDEGVAMTTMDGTTILSYDMFTRDQHNDNYYPQTIKAAYYLGKYYAFHVGGGGFVIDTREKTLCRISSPTYVSAVHVSGDDNVLYFISDDDDADAGSALYKIAGDNPDYLQYTYRSKDFILGATTNFTAARLLRDAASVAAVTASIAANTANQAINAAIFSAAAGTGGVVNGEEVNAEEVNYDGLQTVYSLAMNTNITFNLYADGTLIYTKTVTSDAPFRLPAGVLYKRCYYEIIGYVAVDEVAVATSMEELDAAA